MLTVEQLERWALFGASWRLVMLDDDEVVVDLCTCAGELVERRRSQDRDVIEFVRGTTPASP